MIDCPYNDASLRPPGGGNVDDSEGLRIQAIVPLDASAKFQEAPSALWGHRVQVGGGRYRFIWIT